MEKYRVSLTEEERAELEGLVSVGKGAARKLTHARILLLADTSQGTARNDEDIVAAFRNFESKPKYAHRATIEEIRENDFNRNIARYVDTSEAEQEIDIAAVQGEIDGLEAELKKTRAEIDYHLRELGLVK